MNRSLFALIFSLFFCAIATAQVYPENFIIPISTKKIPASLYKTISFVDSRPVDGLLSKHPRNVTAIPIQNQLTNLLNSITDSTAKNGELLLQLQLFNFTEITNDTTYRGPCYLRAKLYVKKSDRYEIVNKIDTAVSIQKIPNLSNQTLIEGGKIMATFIINNLMSFATDTASYSFDDIKNLTAIEKQKTVLYTTQKYSDGLYLSYQSFIKQKPDQQITVTINDTGKIFFVKTIENGKKLKIASKNIYAIVYNGVPHIATKYGYYPVQKINDDFYFTGNIDVKGDVNDPLGSLSEEETYEMRIDYVNGRFIRLKRIQNEP